MTTPHILEIIPVPALRDNYIWMLRAGRHAVAVDPGEGAPILNRLARDGLELAAVLVTHHHHDHTGGIAELAEAFPHVRVHGPGGGRTEGITLPVADGQHIELPEIGAALEVIGVPGHTLDHVAYYGANLTPEGALFSGDTLFAAGCGRVFEGSMAQMHASLARLAALPPATGIYCAHEYTLANLRFAAAVEPDNEAIRTRRESAEKLQQQGRPTLPSTLADELRTNPFLRCARPEVAASAGRHAGRQLADEEAVFAALREWKNAF